MLAAAVYSAIAGLAVCIMLNHRQASRSRGQRSAGRARLPTTRSPTCLDTTTIRGRVEAAGLNTVALLLDGHTLRRRLAGEAHLYKRNGRQRRRQIRKAIAARELVVFETTGILSAAMTFEQAKRVGRKQS